ncbi:MAG: Rpn family recombination-promoting nuclease/putative transposase [Clostridiales bacterium]|nr:Rpn family recombination-promoting nuclease/putative transposase [Clostridiales bacterium]
MNKSFVTTDYKDTECDLIYEAKINSNKIVFYILLEFQSTIDYRMPLRLLFYMCEVLREYTKNKLFVMHSLFFYKKEKQSGGTTLLFFENKKC